MKVPQIRAVLGLASVVAAATLVVMAWRWMQRLQEEQDAIALLESRGCAVASLKSGLSMARPISVLGTSDLDKNAESLRPALQVLASRIETFKCPQLELTDADVRLIGTMRRLATLTVYGEAISNEGMRNLAGLTRLRLLQVGAPRVTDDGFQWLSVCSRLEILSFFGTPVGDQVFRKCALLKNLVALQFQQNAISQ
ncbi:MAG: hypothetical protein KF847_20790 [Pirellulales bacterium]|nr:hypothetical protein [Pirellulales bacterium]